MAHAQRFVLDFTDRRPFRPGIGTMLAIVGPLLIALAALPVRGAGIGVPASVRLQGDGTSWLVRTTVDGRKHGNFLLDTGASYCVIAPTLAHDLGLPVTGDFATVETANGPVRAPLVRLPSLDLGGGTRVHDVEAIVHDAGPLLDGVIGLNLLNRYRYTVDAQQRLLELE